MVNYFDKPDYSSLWSAPGAASAVLRRWS